MRKCTFLTAGYYVAQNGKSYLVEFKNQNEGNVDSRDIRNKIFDSISMIVMNEDKRRSEICERMNVNLTIILPHRRKHQRNALSQRITSICLLSKYQQFQKAMGI